MVSFSCQHRRPNPVLCGLQSSSCLALDVNTQHKTASDRHSHHGDKSLTVREQLWLRIQSHLLTEWLMGQSSAPQQTVKLLHKCQSKQTGTCVAAFCTALRTLPTTSLREESGPIHKPSDNYHYHLSHNLIQILHLKKGFK